MRGEVKAITKAVANSSTDLTAVMTILMLQAALDRELLVKQLQDSQQRMQQVLSQHQASAAEKGKSLEVRLKRALIASDVVRHLTAPCRAEVASCLPGLGALSACLKLIQLALICMFR